jgi:hypothetical protein
MAEYTEEELRERVWEDLTPFRLDKEGIDQVINEAAGCAVTWVAPNGRAMGVWVSHAVIDGEVWVTTTGNRSKTRAWKRDPRTAAVFGGPRGSVTLLGTIEMNDDAAQRTRFLNALYDRGLGERSEEGRAGFLKHMDSKGRFTGPIKAEKYITFDPQKLVT